jgi:3'-5' exoribonuclease
MLRAKPPLLRLSELTPGQHADFFALLAERHQRETRDGKPFYTCRFRDAHRTVAAVIWADSDWYAGCDADWRPGQFFKIRGVFGEHEKYGPQIEIQNIRLVTGADKADGFSPADFVDRSRFNPEELFAELRELVESHIENEPLRRLVLTIIDRHREPLQRLPATLRHFYPFYGGLVEHILSVTKSCVTLAEKYVKLYPDVRLDKDLLLAGAVLHDMGRVVEFDSDPLVPQPTASGRLLGHLFLGRDLVRDTARELGDVSPETLELLEHLVVSHLNLPEWGSPRLPLIPESLILHHADDLDAKMEMYARCLMRDHAPGLFTARDPVLNRQLYKGRSQ